jgi:hypothetical protein
MKNYTYPDTCALICHIFDLQCYELAKSERYVIFTDRTGQRWRIPIGGIARFCNEVNVMGNGFREGSLFKVKDTP